MSEKIYIFDTTLRDGEQSPGASMNIEEKIQIAEYLDELKVDIIEAGFPIASNGDFEAVSEISKKIKNSTIAGLARAKIGDIDRAWDSIKKAKSPRIHTFIATSPIHMKYKLNKTQEEVLELIKKTVSHARNLCPEVEWSCEDGGRSDIEFLYRTIELAIKSGATIINIPDTVGYTFPIEYGEIFKKVKHNVPNIDKAILSTHTHNDLGLAVANSLSAIKEGARQVECTINGLGERAGNAALEEIVMSLKVRKDLMPFHTDIQTESIIKTSRLVSAITGFTVQPNKAIVGTNAFAHEAGIHQDGMLKHSGTYEIMTPEEVGLNKSKLVMGKHSGKHAFNEKLKELGYEIGDNSLMEIFGRFKDLADKKKEIFDEDIIALIDDQVFRVNQTIKFVSLNVNAGSVKRHEAKLVLEVEGKKQESSSTGDGPVDATFNAIKNIINHGAKLKLYQIEAITAGTDAQGAVTIRLEEDGKTVQSKGSDTDIVVASAKAYINALNKLLVKRTKEAPDYLERKDIKGV
ncbi:MAG: 2-isopropylmalate synthase [Alphaproteobacteria bacterium MarineAlpha5_Bin11]|nr:2-isopropylmalate synthase [Pelagibacteraceae bacterium]PPR43156.1 MAG: 2-isopropylmalate synthase [Alphaproteobacteria bacterium MarineAlpha5_Bin11]PPR50502.1 MAG: 2-isopropylmalate synthase [Alphaproteobacteria bacterium MarineAlpha5_Bin10]|tara:strand:- start:4266 stop:5822 length:1557 start_codon:yes stop_codon:yes gene_type:complete